MSKGRLYEWLEAALVKKQRRAPQIIHMAFDLPESRLWSWLESTLLKKQQKAIIQPLLFSLALPSGNPIKRRRGMLDTVYVCTHALERWRERAAEHYDAPEEEVIKKLREARKIAHDDFLPIPRQQGTHYYHHKDYDAYFVVEPIDLTSCRIITVIIPEAAPKNYILPKTKKPKPKPVPATIPMEKKLGPSRIQVKPTKAVEEVRLHVTPAQADPDTLITLGKVMQRVMPDEPDELPKSDEEKHAFEYRRYVNMMHEVENRLSSLSKNEALRKQLVMQLEIIKNNLKLLKPHYRKYINDLEQRKDESPIRPDGSVNYVSAILHLIKRVDAQQKEIEGLKTAVAFLSSK